ncbi:MAG: peptidoglycan-binding protein [Methylococcaceae bacterium]|nr:MAG: peptidoglycan-binding protein [Methylococcaceae bacterium]
MDNSDPIRHMALVGALFCTIGSCAGLFITLLGLNITLQAVNYKHFKGRAMIKVIKKGSTGTFVMQWQIFLRGQDYLVNSSGMFDEATVEATKQFQHVNNLDVDGVVGNQTLAAALSLGLELVEYAETEADYPPKPTFSPLVNNAARQETFGRLEFEPAPTATNPEGIRITNKWDTNNIVKVIIPQLRNIEGANASGAVHFHRKAADQLLALWNAWEQNDLLKYVLTYSGDYVPRFVRGKADEQVLSNHAFGTAFDINYAWNKLGTEPATEGAKGCVYKLVPIAHQYGFYWGGHFTRRDGMHFEIATIV